MPENTEVKVEPTKELFVYIITRDIEISDAVIDLIDNCIDGAKRLRPGKPENYTDLWINLSFDGNKFSIKDNCGGIPLEVAKKYAFRFGRAKDMKPTPGSVGQFGVGMKRALFKFGKMFEISSKTIDDSFELKVDVPKWLEQKGWGFKLSQVGKGSRGKSTGTEIKVTNLNTDTKLAFADPNTFKRIFSEVKLRQQHFIEKGLKITINNTKVSAELFQIQSSKKLKPAFWEDTFKNIEDSDTGVSGNVKVQIYTGIGKSSPEKAGWYITCNGRVVLDSDKSKKTAWGPPLPHYHNQYAQFRGYVFFNSDHAGILPWTTTKADINENNIVYKKALAKMEEMARPVIRFLDAIDKEKDLPSNSRVLSKIVETSKSMELSAIEDMTDVFTFPTPAIRKTQSEQTISFKRPRSKIEELKKIYEATTPKAVGENAFDEVYSRHVED